MSMFFCSQKTKLNPKGQKKYPNIEHKQKQMRRCIKLLTSQKKKKSSIGEIFSATRISLYKDPAGKSIEKIPLRFKKGITILLRTRLVCSPDGECQDTGFWSLGVNLH